MRCLINVHVRWSQASTISHKKLDRILNSLRLSVQDDRRSGRHLCFRHAWMKARSSQIRSRREHRSLLEEMSVDLGGLMDFHFLQSSLAINSQQRNMTTDHFERIELLLDLLSKHGCQPVAGGNLSASVILAAGPSIVKLYSRTE